MTTVACIQMASGPNIGANLLEAERLIGMAADKGARLIVLPENFAIMGKEESDKVAVRESENGGPIQEFLSQQAARQGIWLVGGTIPLVAKDENKIRAACLLFDDQGRRRVTTRFTCSMSRLSTATKATRNRKPSRPVTRRSWWIRRSANWD